MKVLGVILVSVVLVFGEPPVPSNSYLPVAASQQSSVENLDWKPKESSEFGIKYAAVSSEKAALNNQNSAPSIEYAGQYETPSSQYLQTLEYNGLSSDYQFPPSQFLSVEEKTPLVEEYGIPAAQYKVPSSPSTKYGAPSSSEFKPSSNQQGWSSSFIAPATPTIEYGLPSVPSSKYGAPSFEVKPSSNQQPWTTSYKAPASPSIEYGIPSSPSTKYGAPSSEFKPASNQQTWSSSYKASATPSLQYGVPSSPSTKYGQSSAKYDEQSEPANYDFKYQVQEGDNEFGHGEARQGDNAQGRYIVVLPDGRKQTVEYTADAEGFKPKVTYEQTSNAYGSGNAGYASGYQVGSGHSEAVNGGYQY